MKKNRKPVGIAELVLRDGHQSLIATRMRTDDMLPICGELDAAGFAALEVWGGATFDACVRFLREDPWQRLKKLRKALPHTPLQMLLRGRNLLGYKPYAGDIIDAFVRRAADCGIDIFRIFDSLNDFDNMRQTIESVKKCGKHAQGAVCYTTSPVHSPADFIALGENFAAAGCDSIAVKDMAGIMTPEACHRLVAALKQKISLPLHIHSHATSGLAALCQLRAVEAGADVIDTVISPFSGGASHPPTETMSVMLAEAGYAVGTDANRLHAIADYFRALRPKYWQFESNFTATDPRVLTHHVPGGMISNLSNQLREQKALDKIDEVLAEIPRVRADLGYPPLVTPTSQIVASQAVLNVLSGKRYQVIANEVKNYFLGHYGKIPGAVCQETRKIAVGDAAMESPPLERDEMERLKAEMELLADGEEDVLTYAMFPEVAKVYFQERAANQLTPEPLLPIKERQQHEPMNAAEFNITVHGETYRIGVTGLGHPGAKQRSLFVTIDGVPEEALIETLSEFAPAGERAAAARPQPSKEGHVTTTMPGTVVSVLVAEGDAVAKGDALIVIEAMKMETEIQSATSGTVKRVFVDKGDSVAPDEVLMEICE